MPSHEASSIGLGMIVIIIMISLGIYYLVIANANNGKFVGTLIRENVKTDTTCSKSKNGGSSCSSKYYVEQIFKKGNSTNTCTVTRLTPYYFKGSANNVVENAVLYTQRDIWVTYYSAGVCYDITIRNYYNAIGGSLLGVGCIIPLIILCYIFADIIRNCSENIQMPTIQMPTIQMPTIQIPTIQIPTMRFWGQPQDYPENTSNPTLNNIYRV
jgi:hypothetical protein